MSKYRIGKDIGKLLARVKALEQKAARCPCEDSVITMRVRELSAAEVAAEDRKKTPHCLYAVGGFVGPACPGIAIADIICVSPCPPCQDISRLTIVNAAGATICTLIVRWAAGGRCSDCPPGSARFTWV